jgi:hypothetical protein
MSPEIDSDTLPNVKVPEISVTVYGPPAGVLVVVSWPDAVVLTLRAVTVYEKSHIISARA